MSTRTARATHRAGRVVVLLAGLSGAALGQTPAPPAAPGDTDALREENRRLQEELRKLREEQDRARAAPASGEACRVSNGVRYCAGWAVTVGRLDPRGGSATPIGRLTPKEVSRFVIEEPGGNVERRTTLELRGEGFFNALRGGTHSFLVDLTAHWRNPCQVSVLLAGETVVTVDGRNPSGSGSRDLQPGLHPIAFRFACEVRDLKLTKPTIALRLLAPGDGAPRPFRADGGIATTEIVREAPASP